MLVRTPSGRIVAVSTILAMSVAGMLWALVDMRTAASVGVGAGVVIAGFVGAWLSVRICVGAARRGAGLIVIIAAAKLIVAAAVLWLAFAVWRLDAVWVAAGASVVVIAILGEAVYAVWVGTCT